MKRASYREAIRWIAVYDSNEWLNDAEPIISAPVALVANIFGVGSQRVVADLRRELRKATQ